MRATATAADAGREPPEPTPHAAGGAEPHRGARPSPSALGAALPRRPWRTAAVYAIAGLAYAVVTLIGVMLAERLELFPVRALFLFWNYAWPIVLTIDLVAGTTTAARSRVLGGYLLGFGALTAVGVILSPSFTVGQAVLFWILTNLPATLAVSIVLARPVRGVGPLVLTFMVIAVAGATVALSAAGGDDQRLRQIVVLGGAIGLGGNGIFLGLIALGAIVFGVGGWLVLRWIGARYERKRISDQSITLDAIWLFFAIAHSTGLVFEAPVWVLTGLAAFLTFRLAARAGFAVARSGRVGPGAGSRLLVLRVFALGRRGERLFSRVTTHWRHVGSVQLIAGPDLATTTVEPHEFLDFLHGELSRRFIDGPATLARRLREIDVEPDRDGRYRVNDFFCFDNAWKMVVSRLARDSDAVLVDLRGFSRQNAGVVFELVELVDVVPLGRVVMTVDGTTDERFLRETLEKGKAEMSAGSPNQAADAGHPAIVQLHGPSLRELPLVLSALSRATASA